MSFICTVCRDLITPNVADAANNDNADIVVTKCGHLYHQNCLNGWFNNQNFPRLECPLCKSNVVLAELRRIFPSGDEETDEIINRYQDAKVQHGANRRLQEEIVEKVAQLVETQVKYEEERLAHDLLRFEHSKFVEVVKVNVKTKVQEILAKAEQEKEIIREEGEVFKLQVTTAMEKKDEEIHKLQLEVESLSDLVDILKQQRATLRTLLAESGNKDNPSTSAHVEQPIPPKPSRVNRDADHQAGVQDAKTVDLCIQLLQKLKPKSPGVVENGANLTVATADLRQIAEHLVNNDVGALGASAPVIKKEIEEIDLVSPMSSFIQIKCEKADENEDMTEENGTGEEPDGSRESSTIDTPDSSASESTPDKSIAGGVPNANASTDADSSASPNLALALVRSRSPSPSFADCLSSTVAHRRESEKMAVVAGLQ